MHVMTVEVLASWSCYMKEAHLFLYLSLFKLILTDESDYTEHVEKDLIRQITIIKKCENKICLFFLSGSINKKSQQKLWSIFEYERYSAFFLFYLYVIQSSEEPFLFKQFLLKQIECMYLCQSQPYRYTSVRIFRATILNSA